MDLHRRCAHANVGRAIGLPKLAHGRCALIDCSWMVASTSQVSHSYTMAPQTVLRGETIVIL